MSELFWPTKDPADVLDYAIEWPLDEGETIATSAWVVTGGLVKGVEAVVNDATPRLAVLWLSGGEIGDHTAQNTITTSAGRTYERTARIPVRQL